MHTYKREQGYRYYVYVSPGWIEYFKELADAVEFSKEVNCEIKEVD